MTTKEWHQHCDRVKSEISQYIHQFITPISMSPTPGHGVAWGTGNYIRSGDSTYLLTNKHVIADTPAGARLAHIPGPSDDYVALVEKPVAAGWPIDAGIYNLGNLPRDVRQQIPSSLLDLKFSPVDKELVFWMGYPGYKANRNEPPSEGTLRMTRFCDLLETPAFPVLSQLVPDGIESKDLDHEKHVVVHYPAMAYRDTSGILHHAPNPKGFSGSLLWDTKFVACLKEGKQWVPSEARVCALIWGALEHPKEVVLATKIEHVRGAFPCLSSTSLPPLG